MFLQETENQECDEPNVLEASAEVGSNKDSLMIREHNTNSSVNENVDALKSTKLVGSDGTPNNQFDSSSSAVPSVDLGKNDSIKFNKNLNLQNNVNSWTTESKLNSKFEVVTLPCDGKANLLNSNASTLSSPLPMGVLEEPVFVNDGKIIPSDRKQNKMRSDGSKKIEPNTNNNENLIQSKIFADKNSSVVQQFENLKELYIAKRKEQLLNRELNAQSSCVSSTSSSNDSLCHDARNSNSTSEVKIKSTIPETIRCGVESDSYTSLSDVEDEGIIMYEEDSNDGMDRTLQDFEEDLDNQELDALKQSASYVGILSNAGRPLHTIAEHVGDVDQGEGSDFKISLVSNKDAKTVVELEDKNKPLAGKTATILHKSKSENKSFNEISGKKVCLLNNNIGIGPTGRVFNVKLLGTVQLLEVIEGPSSRLMKRSKTDICNEAVGKIKVRKNLNIIG